MSNVMPRGRRWLKIAAIALAAAAYCYAVNGFFGSEHDEPLIRGTAWVVVTLLVITMNVLAFAIGVKVHANRQRKYIETASDCPLCGGHLRRES